MTTARKYFHMAKISTGGSERIFAMCGFGVDDSTGNGVVFNTVEEWDRDRSEWKTADNHVHNLYKFGATTVPRDLVCP